MVVDGVHFLYRGRSGITANHTPRGDDVAIVFRTSFVLISDWYFQFLMASNRRNYSH